MSYSPKVYPTETPLKLEDIKEELEDKGIEFQAARVVNNKGEEEIQDITYKGDQLDYVFWHRSIIQRYHLDNAENISEPGKLSDNDLEVKELASRKSVEDIELPYKLDKLDK